MSAGNSHFGATVTFDGGSGSEDYLSISDDNEYTVDPIIKGFETV